jgi:hypothetical protein
MVAHVGYSMARQLRGWVTPCAVCTLHMKTRSTGFLVEAQNQAGYGLLVVWPQNHWDSFLRFVLKIGGDGFLRFGIETGGDGFSRFGLKTGGGGFPGLGLKIGSYGLMIWASKSPQQFLGLGLKTK